jgi:hypothetical protein
MVGRVTTELIEPQGSGIGDGVGAGDAARSTDAKASATMLHYNSRRAFAKHPNGSSVRRLVRAIAVAYREYDMLELGIVVLSIVCFVVLDRYVIGCEEI